MQHLRRSLPGLKMQFSSYDSASIAAPYAERTTRSGVRVNSSVYGNTEAPGLSAPRVVVLGGGFGGLYAAVRLESLLWPRGKRPQVTLVDQADRFNFKPLLYEVLNNTATEAEVAPPFSKLLAPYNIRFVQAAVQSVQPTSVLPDGSSTGGGSVQLADGTSLDYDWLVLAIGAQPDARGVPGVKEYSVPFNAYEDAIKVKASLDQIVSSGGNGTVVVVGAGYAGVELASAIAERVKGAATVQLVTPSNEIMESSPIGQRDTARKALASLGVQVLTGTRVKGLRAAPSDNRSTSSIIPTACTVDLDSDAPSYTPYDTTTTTTTATSTTTTTTTSPSPSSSNSYVADLVVWTAGSAPVTKERRKGFPFPVTDKGAVQTEATLRVQQFDRVFALGDVSTAVAAPSTRSDAQPVTLPATAQVAFQQADYAAWNLWASINGRPLLPFRYQHLGNMMALGSLNGAVALPFAIPQPIASTLTSTPLGPILEAAGVKLSNLDPESGVTLEGPLAAVVRRAAYLYRQPTNEQRVNVAADWLRQGLSAVADLAGSASASRR